MSSEPVAIVAAGQQDTPCNWLNKSRKPASELCWLHLRGEVLTNNGRESVCSGCSASAGAISLIGQALYKLNTTPSFLSWMYRHVSYRCH